MAWNIRERKTEHAGAKHGNGAYWGPKAIAKHASNKERRTNDRRAVVLEVELATAATDTRTISDQTVYRAKRRVRHDTRRWCAGKVGRPHQFVLQETLGPTFGLPALHVWACSRCGRKVYNLKAPQRHDDGAVVNRAAV